MQRRDEDILCKENEDRTHQNIWAIEKDDPAGISKRVSVRPRGIAITNVHPMAITASTPVPIMYCVQSCVRGSYEPTRRCIGVRSSFLFEKCAR